MGYTALGSAATSAVGLLRIEPDTGPVRALVPGIGYARLQVDAASAPGALLFIHQGADFLSQDSIYFHDDMD